MKKISFLLNKRACLKKEKLNNQHTHIYLILKIASWRGESLERERGKYLI